MDVRREIARVETQVALCTRCYGDEARLPARLARPRGPGRILVLGDRPSRRGLVEGLRLGLDNPDPGTTFLRQLVREAGIPEEEVLLATALLCRPVSTELEAAIPESVCRSECSLHLRELVEAVHPKLIVTLGRGALQGIRRAFSENDDLRKLRFPADLGRTVSVGEARVHPLYHTTVRARVTRPAGEQRLDWRAVGRLWRWIRDGEEGRRPMGRRRR